MMNNEDDIISRSQQKRDTQALQALGEELVGLANKQLTTIPLTPTLLEAILTAKKIKPGNALKRQFLYIGKLIRKTNHQDIRAAIDHLKQQDSLHEIISQQAEQWRDKLVEDKRHQTLSDFIEQYPHCDRQKLNQLVRAAEKEIKTNHGQQESQHISNKQMRALFKQLREAISQSHLMS